MGLHPVYKTLLIALVSHSKRNISIIFSKRRTCRCGAGVFQNQFRYGQYFPMSKKVPLCRKQSKKIYNCFFVSLSQHNLRYPSFHDNFFMTCISLLGWCPVPPIHLCLCWVHPGSASGVAPVFPVQLLSGIATSRLAGLG